MIDDIAAAISAATGTDFLPREPTASIGGGCINQAFKLSDGALSYFVKTNQADRLPMFEAEAAGLEDILATQAIYAPRPICFGVSSGQAWLVLEFLDMGGRSPGAHLGRQLAHMHRHTAAQFGWKLDNTIGATHQPNPWTTNWVEFLHVHRLAHQLNLAAQNGLGRNLQRKGDALLARLDDFFTDYRPVPSLLHGDLWGGNAATLTSGEPVIFDPAVYYGDREADLAMTELFGGFDADFYAAYNEAWALDPGYRIRKTLYNLYHILNHANLFGGGYASQAEHMMGKLLAEAS